MTKLPTEHEELLLLARAYGVQTSYDDAWGNYVEAGPEALLGVLRALQAPVDGMADVGAALRERHEELAGRMAEPVVVAWDGHAPSIEVRLAPGDAGSGALAWHLDLEGGERRAEVADLDALPRTEGFDGRPGRRLSLPEPLPFGYHHLTVEQGGRSAHTLVISAPSRCFAGDGKPFWGVFLPLYALRTSRSWGAGDFSDLETLAEWTAGLGGGMVGTLPILAAFLDEPCEPSPYAPASRLFWNELYLDPRRLPEFEDCAAARRLVESPDFQREVEALRAAPRVDYPRLMALKRRVLEELRSALLLPRRRAAGGAGALRGRQGEARRLRRLPRRGRPPGRALAALARAAARRHPRPRRLRRGRPALLPLHPVGRRAADPRSGQGGPAARPRPLPGPAAGRPRQLLRRLARPATSSPKRPRPARRPTPCSPRGRTGASRPSSPTACASAATTT